MAQQAHVLEQSGFVGAVSGMSLADIIQVKGTNRYSGCLVVEHKGKSGMVFFREGDVIHSEQGELSGEDAFYSIMGWVGGTFRSEPKLATTSRTIDQTLGYLILEALRRMDEAQENLQKERQADSGSSREGGDMSDINSKLAGVSGVELAVIMTKDGQVVDDTSYKAELLAAHSLYLSLFASQVASQFGVGGLKSVTAQGTEHHLLLFDSKRHHLCISASGESQLNSLESDIRRILADK
ncbi:MAG: DUF4388 domain-containing protein [Deltaproteobacteria bacterium]|nr:DUF4388 domain-containing protein [Deltaproteobacteria bacterium]